MTLRSGAPRQIMIYAFITGSATVLTHDHYCRESLSCGIAAAQTTVYRPITRGNWPRAYQTQISDPEQFFCYYYSINFFTLQSKIFCWILTIFHIIIKFLLLQKNDSNHLPSIILFSQKTIKSRSKRLQSRKLQVVAATNGGRSRRGRVLVGLYIVWCFKNWGHVERKKERNRKSELNKEVCEEEDWCEYNSIRVVKRAWLIEIPTKDT